MQTVPSSSSKVARSRERMRSIGLRPVQFWVPDTRSLSYVDDLRQQCLALKGTAAEAEVMEFSEHAAAQVEGWA